MVIESRATAEVSGEVEGVAVSVVISGRLVGIQDPAIMRDFVHRLAEAAEQAIQRLGGDDGGDGISQQNEGGGATGSH